MQQAIEARQQAEAALQQALAEVVQLQDQERRAEHVDLHLEMACDYDSRR